MVCYPFEFDQSLKQFTSLKTSHATDSNAVNRTFSDTRAEQDPYWCADVGACLELMHIHWPYKAMITKLLQVSREDARLYLSRCTNLALPSSVATLLTSTATLLCRFWSVQHLHEEQHR